MPGGFILSKTVIDGIIEITVQTMARIAATRGQVVTNFLGHSGISQGTGASLKFEPIANRYNDCKNSRALIG